MNTRQKLAQLSVIDLGDSSGKPIEVHEMYNHAGYIIDIYVKDKLEFRTISYKFANELVGDKNES